MTARTINIIGAGRIGQALGSLMVNHASVVIGGICNKTPESAQNAVRFIGSGTAYQYMHELPPADITLLTIPDDIIASVVDQIVADGIFRPNSVIIHCSGALSCNILSRLHTLGYSIAGVHPLRSFSKPNISLEEFSGTYCAIEGDEIALSLLKPLLKSIGAITHEIEPDFKAAYHAAAIFASSYMVTLAQKAWLCLLDAGVEKKLAMNMVVTLMQSTVKQIEQQSEPAHALTGPIQRGDTATIKLHLNTLRSVQQKKLYSILGKATLPLTKHNQVMLDCLQHTLEPTTENQ